MRLECPTRALVWCLAFLLCCAGAVRGEVNRWDTIGPPAYPQTQILPTVYGIAFGSNGTLFAADATGIFKSSGDGLWVPLLQVPTNSLPPSTPYIPFLAVSAETGSPDTLLAGLATGGIYRSTDAGATWAGSLGGAGFLSLARASSSPGVAYASMRQLNQQLATYKSTDGGVTWVLLAALGVSPVRSLAVDPTSSDVVFGAVGASAAGLPPGAYRSTDGGGTWSRLAGGLADDAYTAFAVDPVSPRTVYAGSSTSGVYRSADGGEHWSAINEGLGSHEVRQIVIDPASPTTVYAGTTRGLYRSADGGGHWSSVGFHQELITALAVDPAAPSTVYAGGIAGLGRITLAPPQPCVPGPEALCLKGGRFRVEATWRGQTPGTPGVGQAAPITGDTGYFWFFDAANIELVVKVLGGAAVNGNFWVFFGALSNVEYMITVTDTQTGVIQSYFNYGGLRSVADTSAFPGAAEAASVTRGSPPVALATAPTGPCVPDAHALCLLGGRFRVRVGWQPTPEGPTQLAAAVGLTDDTGYFWFFDAANVEVVVKVLDGTAVNGHFWVFYGALSDVAYAIKVIDMRTLAEQTYQNPQGTLASVADTQAFEGP